MRPERNSTLQISAKVFVGEVAEGWARLRRVRSKEFPAGASTGRAISLETSCLALDGDDEFREAAFEAAAGVLPGVLDLLDWGNGEFPLLMQAWVHNGARKWMPWEDFTTQATDH